jgi:mono/diheme cytochrome c family protein
MSVLARTGRHHLIARPPAAAVVLLLTLGLAAGPLAAHTPITTRFNYRRDVLPIVERRCGSCHRPGGIGPMSLLSYEAARPWAAAIRAEVLAGRMPPWPIEEGLRFAGERALSAREIDVIADWTSGGAPEGRAEDGAGALFPGASFASKPLPPPEPESSGAAAEGLVLRMPSPHALARGAAEERFEVRLNSGIDRERWIGGFDLRPGNPAILHGVLIHLHSGDGPGELLGSWTPGQPPVRYPPGTGRRLPAGAELRLLLHYRRGFQQRGDETPDRSELVLGLLSSAPAVIVRSFRLAGSPALPPGARLLSLTPVLEPGATAGGVLAVEATVPGGRRLLLFSGRSFDPRWPIALRPVEPPDLPAGTRLELRAAEPARPAPAGEVWVEIAR